MHQRPGSSREKSLPMWKLEAVCADSAIIGGIIGTLRSNLVRYGNSVEAHWRPFRNSIPRDPAVDGVTSVGI